VCDLGKGNNEVTTRRDQRDLPGDRGLRESRNATCGYPKALLVPHLIASMSVLFTVNASRRLGEPNQSQHHDWL
jgi:hypothetical protein